MTAPFESKLNTNYCPTEAECADIKAFLVEPTIRLRRLDAVIRQLTAERDKLAVEVAAHEALISPMRRMPNDILQEIFVACLPEDRNPAMSASEAPVLLGRICGAWRDLVLATPRLWAKIHIVEPCPTAGFDGDAFVGVVKAKVEQRLQALQSWLARSGDCPLSISFAGNPRRGTNPVFIQTLVTFVRRWRDIHFSLVPNQTVLEDLQELAPFELTNLRRLGFESTIGYPSQAIDWDLALFSAPLSSLSLWNWVTRIDVLPLQWDKLTELEIGNSVHGAVSQHSILEILAKCHNLQTCHLLLKRQLEFTRDSSQPLIQCAALDSLKLFGPTAFLACLSCPVLRRLKLRSDSMSVDPQPITHLLTSTHLHHIAIDIDFQPEYLLQVISALPHSTLLHLELAETMWSEFGASGRIDDDVLMHLADDGCCPRLENLVLRNCESISDAGVARFLHARLGDNASSSSLRCVRVESEQRAHDSGDEDDLRALLRPFLEAGVDVSITRQAWSTPSFSPFLGSEDYTTRNWR
ncbi:hypothetical protein C8F01DRAFT_1318544 [Mycena amicta]|nr:hypothetical protein C8F01DRAFT_1318544 [Mycena amicta]